MTTEIKHIPKYDFGSFHHRKEARREYFNKYVKGWKTRPCTACNGSGYYDNDGSPSCSCCNGMGRERYRPIL